MSVQLPVSFGEALDKLTILELKLVFIKDEQKLYNVKKEWTELHTILETYISKVNNLYNLLYKINERIWILQDEIRKGSKPVTSYVDVVEENDARCRVKNKINKILSSIFFEEKGYNKKKVILNIPFDTEDIVKLNCVVRYLSTIFDETLIMCFNQDTFILAKSIYNDDDTIIVMLKNDERKNVDNVTLELTTTLRWIDIKDEIIYYNQFNIPEINSESMKNY